MNVASALPLVHERSLLRRVIAMPDVVAVSGLAFYVTVLFALTWGTWGDLDSDTGYDVVASTRIADGEVPYRDFIYYYGPLAPALGALVQLVGISPLSAAIALGVAVTAGILVATYILARSFTGVLGAVLATAITAAVALIPNNFNFVLPHTAAATIGMLCVLVLLIALGRASEMAGAAVLLTAGSAIGLATLTKPEPAAAALLTGAAWVVVRRHRGASRRAIALLAAPALVIPVVVYGLFAGVAGAHNLVFENLYPRDVLAAGGDVLLRVRMPLTLESVVELGGRVLLYGLGCGALALVALALGRGGRIRLAALSATALAAFAGIGLFFARPEALRHGLEFVYAWIPAGALIVLLVLLVCRRRSSGSAAFDREIVAVTALSALAFFTYGAFYLHAPHSQMAVYAVPLAAIFLARLHLHDLAVGRNGMLVGAAWLAFLAAVGTGLTLKDARVETVTVKGAAGSIAETPEEAALYTGALSWIERKTGPEDRILVAPMLTGLYTLSGRSSPLPEIALIPGALPSAAAEERAIERLDAAKVPLVVTDDREWPGYGHTSFGKSFDQQLAAWVRENYTRAAVIRAPAHETFEGNNPERTLSVWLRRDA